MVLEKKKAQEKEIFQLTLERNELKSHLDKLQDEMENIGLEETQRRGKGRTGTSKLDEGASEEVVKNLKEQLEKYEEKIRKMEGDTPLKKEFEKVQNRCEELEEANKELEEKLSGDPEVFAKARESLAVEQLSSIILSKAKNLKNIDEETKQNIQRFLGENFSHVTEPLYVKSRELESRNKALKQKLQDKVHLLSHFGRVDLKCY